MQFDNYVYFRCVQLEHAILISKPNKQTKPCSLHPVGSTTCFGEGQLKGEGPNPRHHLLSLP